MFPWSPDRLGALAIGEWPLPGANCPFFREIVSPRREIDTQSQEITAPSREIIAQSSEIDSGKQVILPSAPESGAPTRAIGPQKRAVSAQSKEIESRPVEGLPQSAADTPATSPADYCKSRRRPIGGGKGRGPAGRGNSEVAWHLRSRIIAGCRFFPRWRRPLRILAKAESSAGSSQPWARSIAVMAN